MNKLQKHYGVIESARKFLITKRKKLRADTLLFNRALKEVEEIIFSMQSRKNKTEGCFEITLLSPSSILILTLTIRNNNLTFIAVRFSPLYQIETQSFSS